MGHQCSNQGKFTNFMRKRYQIRLIAAAAFAGGASLLLLRQYVPIFNALGMKIQEHPSHQVLLIRLMLMFLVMLLIGSWIFVGWSRVNEWLHRRRWWIGLCVVVIATLLNLSGSSLNIWNAFLGRDWQENTVFGIPRTIRSDEYAVNTLWAFSQQYNDYDWFNYIIGNRASDMYIVKDAPIFSIAEIFRPFHWGYLLFGSGRGLAFYWSSRLVVLFLVTYEFFLLLTKSPGSNCNGQRADMRQGNRGVAVSCAILISFSSLVQWWFAVNNLVEMIIDIFGAVLLFNLYLSAHRPLLRGCYAVCILLCAGSFIWTLYPAWQIPMGYVLIALVIWQLVEHWGSIRMTSWDWGILALVGVVFIAAMGYIAYHSRDTIHALLNTAYPGNRSCPGGDGEGCPDGRVRLLALFSPSANIALAFAEPGNAPELGSIIDFAPLGFTLALMNIVFNKKKRFDILSITSVIMTVILCVYSTIGLPLTIADALGLSMSTSKRATLGFELLNIMLLARSAVSREWKVKNVVSVPVSAGVAGVFVWLAVIRMREILENPTRTTVIIAVLLTFIMYMGVCLACVGHLGGHKDVAVKSSSIDERFWKRYPVYATHLFECIASATMLCLVFAGACVNPIQLGSNAIDRQPIIIAARSIEDSGKPGIWMAEGDNSRLLSNLMAANGLATVNTVQVTPNQSLWASLDPSRKLRYRYNRYAFIEFEITNRQLSLSNQIKLLNADIIQLNINAAQLANLGVTYIVSNKDLSQYSYGGYSFIQVSVREGGYAVWHLS
ncbi:hypothetical protein CQR48_0398 [Bifidobacterium thermophilum]|nr:hypothetical protein CQR48_0398 [Bifidobacterium thermophilum]